MSAKRALGLFLVGWPVGVCVFALSFWTVESVGWVALAVPAYLVVVAASARLGMRLLDV